MADISTPSAAAMSTIDAGVTQPEKQHKTRPEKPDEAQYKEDLAKAEKEHAAAQAKLVCHVPGKIGFRLQIRPGFMLWC